MAAHATLVGRDFRLGITADRYERPDATDSDDANWVVGEVAVEIRSLDRFDARVGVSLRTHELADFARDLKVLVDTLTGEATLHHIEDQVHVTIKLDHGAGSIDGYVKQHALAELRFKEIETDQTFLAPAAREFEALTRVFPIRNSGD